MAEGDAASTEGPIETITYRPFRPEDLHAVIELVSATLPEPYVRTTYYYFLSTGHGWPHLSFLAFDAANEPVGAIVCKQEQHGSQRYANERMRGYIAMLSVRQDKRRKGIARRLVGMAVDTMRANKADEIVLETAIDNRIAIALYHSLGFFTLKVLHRFYFSGQDAVRLVLPLTLFPETPYASLLAENRDRPDSDLHDCEIQ